MRRCERAKFNAGGKRTASAMDNLTEKHNSIVEGVIWKQLLLFFFPILLGTFFQQLYNTVDAAVVGKFVGKEALAAVGRRDGYAHQFVCRLFCRAFLGRNRHHFPILRREKGEAHRGLGAHRRRDGHRRRPAADCGRNASGADDAANDGYARRRPCAGRNLSAHLFRRNGFQPALQHRLRHPARHRRFAAAAVRSDRLHADQSCTRPAVRPCVSYGRRPARDWPPFSRRPSARCWCSVFWHARANATS